MLTSQARDEPASSGSPISFYCFSVLAKPLDLPENSWNLDYLYVTTLEALIFFFQKSYYWDWRRDETARYRRLLCSNLGFLPQTPGIQSGPSPELRTQPECFTWVATTRAITYCLTGSETELEEQSWLDPKHPIWDVGIPSTISVGQVPTPCLLYGIWGQIITAVTIFAPSTGMLGSGHIDLGGSW